jgi:hypothetical protein
MLPWAASLSAQFIHVPSIMPVGPKCAYPAQQSAPQVLLMCRPARS